MLDLRDPDSLSHKEREEQRKEKETAEFNPDHYLAGKSADPKLPKRNYLLADLHDGDPMIEEACQWQPDTFEEKFTTEQQEKVSLSTGGSTAHLTFFFNLSPASRLA